MTDRKRVAIVPCSGIGKTYGSVSRDAAYDVTEDMRPAETQLVPLSLLVLGDEAARCRRRCAGYHHRRLQVGLCDKDGQGKRRNSGSGFRRA